MSVRSRTERISPVLLVLLVVLAGCSGIFDGTEQSSTPTTTDAPTTDSQRATAVQPESTSRTTEATSNSDTRPSETTRGTETLTATVDTVVVTETAERVTTEPPGRTDTITTETASTTGQRTTATPTPTSRATTDTPGTTGRSTRAVLLDADDVGREYSLSGERYLDREDSSEDTATQLQSADIQLLFERTFNHDTTGTAPQTILSSVTRYDDEQSAREEEAALISQIRRGGGETETIRVVTGINATRLSFENDRGLVNTLVISRSGPVVYYAVTSDQDEYYPDFTRELFVEMAREVA